MANISKSLLILILVGFLGSCTSKEEKVLVFSKTEGFRHGSIEAGVVAMKKLGEQNGFSVDATEDATYFTEEILRQYSAVVFLNTTGDVLNEVQQADFERYIQAGGGFFGIHAATDTEYGWPWYNKLVGAYFKGHPKTQEAKLNIVDKSHPATKFMADTWMKTDEWYNFRDINPDIKVLIEIDESSYEGGENGEHHPISWYHDFDGGRSFYTEMGHTDATFENPDFLDHVLGGLHYVIGKDNLDYSKAKTERIPEENRYVRTVLDFNLNEPMELEELPSRGILFVERRGALKLYDFKEEKTKQIAQLNLFYGNEDGLLGIAVDPNYQKNNWIYLFYSAPGEISEQRISRFTLVGDSLDLASEKNLLTIPTLRKCCHSGGALEFGPDGNLYIGLGDNTNPFESSGYAPIDEREGRALWDAQKSAANTNDLRGKILRIRPEDDGTYSIPEGNLFPVGTPNTRPEIYVMGSRNPFRFSIDSSTGYLYWGDVGPDAGKGDPNRGPHGMGEFDQARKAGNWGWPYTRGNNQPYNDYNFATETSGKKFNPAKLINDSPNNTGIRELPPAQESMIWFSYAASEEFPWLGSGGVNPMAGPIYHASNYPNATNNFPEYFENKILLYEWMRDWVYVVTLDENHSYVKADPFMPSSEFSHPMDMLFASDGNLYVLEYGQKWNSQNMDARLNRIGYVSGNRKPVSRITSDKMVGAHPFTVRFSGSSSEDFDKDQLKYEWFFNSDEVQDTSMEPSFTFNEPGNYTVRLKVTDEAGNTDISNQRILVGNDIPELKIELDTKNKTYWDGRKVAYKVVVTDKQDGSTLDGTIDPKEVKVTFDYIPEGKDMVMATLGHQQNTIPEGKLIMDNTDCKACHAVNVKVNGPTYEEIAARYSSADKNYLIDKIIKGGSGVWGESMMSAHPQLKVAEVDKIVDYILSLDPKMGKNENLLPLSGEVAFNAHKAKRSQGKYVLMASYSDKGSKAQPESSLSARDQIIFKFPKFEGVNADEKSGGLSKWEVEGEEVIGSIKNNSYLKFNDIGLEGLKNIELFMYFGADYPYEGTVEIRENSSSGNLIGKSSLKYFNKEHGAKKKYDIPVKPSSDFDAIYLVFKGAGDKEQIIGNFSSMMLIY
ncbi:ThuA domain-containing protein [Arenibacter sp. BSSL-BM3]|uniref:ThuA domain-containing protein n=1 Tax=Arenibacter arenosicollis TaxID=2762274 RepID=A0ABR7QP81_9FLAO|nr:ThuA domain-containing protein [Arenibacter arenosicollis]MBC8768720.1 ThuA domain-containing protein [Arenibacter arenosicollis]